MQPCTFKLTARPTASGGIEKTVFPDQKPNTRPETRSIAKICPDGRLRRCPILRNAPILVLDEATSSLDSESEGMIQDALEKLMKGKTVIVIAHRLSTIRKMDRIIFIDEGQIKEEGTHAELEKKENGSYRRLWEMQAGGFVQE